MHNIIPRLSDNARRLRRPAPALGEHTAEILGPLGLDGAELDALAREGIVGMAQPETATCRYGARCCSCR